MLVQNNSYARLIIERGAPYEKGMCFPLPPQNEVIIGRATSLFKPDISFSSLLISRKHCCISQPNGIWSIAELGSKHGTALNGKPLSPHLSYSLHQGDKIILAASLVLLRFSVSPEFEKTLDFDTTQSLQPMGKSHSVLPVIIDTTRKALYISSLEIPLSVKEWCLLELLYTNRNKLVSYSEIRTAVWAERPRLDTGIPDVGFDEINLLLYRLRRKLGPCRRIIKTHRGQGCILEIE